MNAEVFVDTNIFLYSIDDSPAAANKRSLGHETQSCRPYR